MSQVSFILQKQGSSIFKDSGSKFFGFAFPVTTAQAIKERLDSLHQQYPDATRICFAWCLGLEHWRTSDGGEPAHSAGFPILRQIQAMQLTNTLVAVVRYFGGKKLGVPGLIHAFGEAARLALLSGELADYKVYSSVKISFQYTHEGEVSKILKAFSAQVKEQAFAEGVTMSLEVETVLFADFLKVIEGMYGIDVLKVNP